MKGNDGTGNIVERDDWETPQWLFDKLNKQYNFAWDCCATKENKKCEQFSKDFIVQKKGLMFNLSTCWMNPPFSKAELMFKKFFTIVEHGIAIYRCDNMETKLWQNIILKHATWIYMPDGRIHYEGKSGKGARFPSALIGFNVKPPKELDGYSLIVQEASK